MRSPSGETEVGPSTTGNKTTTHRTHIERRPSAAPGGSRDLTYVPGHGIPFARALDYGK